MSLAEHFESNSVLLRHEPCPACGSRDNLGRYSDGHGYCFGCGHHEQGDELDSPSPRVKVSGALIPLEEGELNGLVKRSITEETVRKFGYFTATYMGKPVQVANYYDRDGKLVAQKVRGKDKKFKVLGDLKMALPFGSHVWPKGGKKIVVTEGEIDALSMSQVQGNSWPVVSIACGAGPQVKKYIGGLLDYFNGFEEVILMFDSDEAGREGAKNAALILGRKAKVAFLPLKDVNEMLIAGRAKELIDAMWKAQPHRPEGIVDMATLKEAIKTPPKMGLSWPWPLLTKLTYGIPERTIVALGGATGGGKTDFLTQTMMHLVTEHRESVGVFSLEQHIVETATRIAGKFAGKTFHVPDSGWTDADKDAAWEKLMEGGKVFLYDSFGVNDWDSIQEKIAFLRSTEGVRYFFIDNLTALAAAEDDERKGLVRIMAEMGSLVQALDITIFLVSHLATPEGKPHEEGGRVFIRHFKGAREIGFWSYLMLGLERDQQDEDENARAITTIRVLKERKTGRGVGKLAYVRYDFTSGMLTESDAPGKNMGFRDESAGKDPDSDSDF